MPDYQEGNLPTRCFVMAQDDARSKGQESDQAAQNKRKLEEHLSRLQAGKETFEKGDRDFSKFHVREKGGDGGNPLPQPPPQPAGWEAWKSAHRGSIHTLSQADLEKMARETDFGLLGLKLGAHKDEVKKAFNTLAKKHHPDLGGDAEIFQALRAAHDRIMKE